MNTELKNMEFEVLQRHIQALLQPFLKQKQNGELEARAQQLVNDYFQRAKARKKQTVMESAGLIITGCKLAFEIGKIGVARWRTEFLVDPFGSVELQPNIVPLGYVNGFQLYIAPQVGLPPTLVARQGPNHQYATWNPKIMGVPPANTVFFIALERCKALGYLDLLKGSL